MSDNTDTPTDTPENTAHTALIVVDVQNDFCPGGSLGTERGDEVAARIGALDTSGYDHVVATMDWHIDPGSHFAPEGEEPNFTTTWPVHCVADSHGAQLHPGVSAMEFDAIFRKGEYTAAYSGFEAANSEGTGLAEWLNERGVTQVDIAGIATDYCVRATVLDACEQTQARVRVLRDLCSPVAEETERSAIEEMRDAGAEIVD
ncbi:nicotinamidase [Corynebacterium propinquum]|uniref:nicotinamidase n=1 Tax=Corynebacterium propinquum TaxID=43769 RepID=UPI0020BE7F28|nr:nicotinamidase [Corynebacterium propinquum]UQV60716.1 nicotinamidase [Corynebacterium propinquum]